MEIYILDTSPLCDPKTFAKYFSKCPDYRKQKIALIKNEADRRLSLGVEILLAHGMSEKKLSPYEICISPSGKPFAKNADIHFSLSHSGKYAVAAFSDSNIGVDIEMLKKVNLKLSERFFSISEQQIIDKAQNKELEFLKIWTRKEALLKTDALSFTGELSDICTAKPELTFNKKRYTLSTKVYADYILSCAFCEHDKISSPENIIIT